MIVVVAMFLLALLVVALYLYVSGVFNTSSLGAFRLVFYILLAVFALTVVIGLIQLSYEGYDQTASTP